VINEYIELDETEKAVQLSTHLYFNKSLETLIKLVSATGNDKVKQRLVDISNQNSTKD